MKKYIAPELNVTKFDVEDVITTSITNITDTANVYGNADKVQKVDFTDVFGK